MMLYIKVTIKPFEGYVDTSSGFQSKTAAYIH